MTPASGEYVGVSYTNTIRNGVIPVATGKIAKRFAESLPEDHIKIAQSTYTFLSGVNPQCIHLNAEKRLGTALVDFPNSNLSKVVYALGFGASGIKCTSKIDEKVLALTSESYYPAVPPNVIILPGDLDNYSKVITPSNENFQNTLITGGGG